MYALSQQQYALSKNIYNDQTDLDEFWEKDIWTKKYGIFGGGGG